MLDRLAIILVGEQNSGKTSTIRQFNDFYSQKSVTTLKKGFRYNISPFKPKYMAIKIAAYILASSPTESNIPLKDSIDPIGWLPDFIIMPEQTNGMEYSNSIHYLMSNEYELKEFAISDIVGDGVWDKWQTGDTFIEEAKLFYRRELIAEYIREFLIKKTCL